MRDHIQAPDNFPDTGGSGGFVAGADALAQATRARGRRSRQQDGQNGLGLADGRRDLSVSGRGSLGLTTVRGRRTQGGRKAGMAHSDGNGIGQPVVLYAPRARRLDLDPIRELPYGPAALNGRTEGRTEVSTQLRPHHPADCPCVHGGVHRRERDLASTAPVPKAAQMGIGSAGRVSMDPQLAVVCELPLKTAA